MKKQRGKGAEGQQDRREETMASWMNGGWGVNEEEMSKRIGCLGYLLIPESVSWTLFWSMEYGVCTFCTVIKRASEYGIEG